MVANYEIVVTLETGKEIKFVKEGYKAFTSSIEQYPYLRDHDVNGVFWQINTKKVVCMQITKLEDEGFKAKKVEDDEDE